MFKQMIKEYKSAYKNRDWHLLFIMTGMIVSFIALMMFFPILLYVLNKPL